MNLATGAVVMRNKVWEQPAAKMVIKAVERMAEQQGIEILKIAGRAWNKIGAFYLDSRSGGRY